MTGFRMRGAGAAALAIALGCLPFATSHARAQGAAEAAVEAVAEGAESAAATTPMDPGHTAWMLVCCGLVLLMTPGLALFYGGMVRTKNVLGTMMHSIFCMALITVQWVVIGYSLAFGSSVGGFFGNPMEFIFLNGVSATESTAGREIPDMLFMAFQMMFAIITPALISGAFAERIRFAPFVVFSLLWATIVYAPVAHWVWGDGILGAHAANSWLMSMFGTHAIDFAGGTVVHISSGVSALVFVLMIGKRRGYPKTQILPNNLVLSVIGAGLLWVGWFGFNGGSGLLADGTAVNALVVTHVCAAVGAISWSLVEWLHHGKVSMLGVITGLVAGLVCITPAAGTVDVPTALILGLIVGPVCYFCVAVLKAKLGYDDSLDAFGVHGVGGTVGAVLSGVFVMNAEGVVEVGFGSQLGAQVVATLVSWIYAGVVTAVLVFILDKAMGFRVTEDDELTGLDVTQHGERAYNL